MAPGGHSAAHLCPALPFSCAQCPCACGDGLSSPRLPRIHPAVTPLLSKLICTQLQVWLGGGWHGLQEAEWMPVPVAILGLEVNEALSRGPSSRQGPPSSRN